MRRYADKALSLAGAATLLTMGAMSPAVANWQASNDGQGFISAQACAGASNRCVRLQCLAMEGGGVSWYIDAPEPGYSAESTAVTWTIDNHRFAPLEMTKAGPAEGGVQSYEAAFDQAKHQALVEALKAGNRLTVSGDQFAPMTVSLRGSGNALTQTLSDCPLTSTADTGETVPVRSYSSPLHAVTAMMELQACKATEEEIFGAITDAGFGIWDANQFIAMGAENGVLQLVDKTDGIRRYRLPACKAKTPAQKQPVVGGSAAYPGVIIPALDEFAEICSVANRDDVFVPEALTRKDINGDGKPDYILDFQKLSCGGGLNMFCGAQMCEFAVYASHGGAYVSGRYLGYGAHFGEDAVLTPCPGKTDFATVRYVDGELVRQSCQ